MPGEQMSSIPAPNRRGKILTFACRNDRCKKGGNWLVQVLPDGSIPDSGSGKGVKSFPVPTPGQMSAGRAILEDVIHREHNHE